MHMRISLGKREFEMRERIPGWHAGVYTRIPEKGVVTECVREAFADSEKAVAYNAEFSVKTKDWLHDPGFQYALGYLSGLEQEVSLLDIGCSIGKLAYALQDVGLWGRVSYSGVDRRGASIELADKLHPDASFMVWNVEKESNPLEADFDIVLAKGVLCYTADPFRALEKIQACSRGKLLLLHMPLSPVGAGQNGFVTSLFSSPSAAYLFTIMEEAALNLWFERHGFEIERQRKRPASAWVENYGPFHLHDLVVERKR